MSAMGAMSRSAMRFRRFLGRGLPSGVLASHAMCGLKSMELKRFLRSLIFWSLQVIQLWGLEDEDVGVE